MPSPDDVRIGDFTRSTVDPPKPTTGQTKEKLEALETQLDAEASKDEAALKPMTSYEERLKEIGIDRAKAAEIIDAVLLKGYYAEDVKITSKIKARLRTRSARDTKRATELLEAQRLTIDTHYNEALTRILLAASLEQFGDDRLPHVQGRKASNEDIEKAFQERITYVDGMSDPAMRVMFAKLAKFDRMVATALEEGSIENF
jgi:hypothetical protein